MDKTTDTQNIALAKAVSVNSHQESRKLYADFCKPKLSQLLRTIRLDKIYHRGEGDYLYYYDDQGKEKEVLDFLGGYGASLFGHNNPHLVNIAVSNLRNSIPFNIQASCRSKAGILCEKLNHLISHQTGKTYITTLANSGAEAVEAAIKHAEFVSYNKLNHIRDTIRKRITIIEKQYLNGDILLSTQFHPEIQRKLGVAADIDFIRQLWAIRNFNYRIFKTAPTFLALTKSFHGKTTGAVSLTYHENYRIPFNRIGLNVIFIEPDDSKALENVIETNTITYYTPEINENKEIYLAENSYVNISAMFIEPIQGEGGMNIIPKELLRYCREISQKHGFHLVFDEIQSGMGRTGTFLFSEQQGIHADYYLLSKSLGGGLGKISALMIDTDLYEPDFGDIHSSTFAEDEHSAAIALAALDLLESDDYIMKNCTDKGEYLKKHLEKIKANFPGVIKSVRGKGLMLGIEFCDMSESGSRVLRMLSKQKLIGYVIIGYLLNEHNIRVAPTMSNSSIIRLEPSAYVTTEMCDKLISAIEKLSEVLYKQNIYHLSRFIIKKEQPNSNEEIKNYRKNYVPYKKPKGIKKVGFIGHFINAEDIPLFDDGFTEFTISELHHFTERVYKLIEPQFYDHVTVQSINGEMVSFNFIGLFNNSHIIGEHILNGDLDIIQKKIENAVKIAEEYGCQVIGLGGFSSIVTRNCQSIITNSAALTSGNSFTVAMGLEAMRKATTDIGIDLSKSCVTVIGATGNICSIYSEIIAESVPRIILIGREGKEKKLKYVASTIYANSFKEILAYNNSIHTDEVLRLRGIARKIYATASVKELLQKYNEVADIGMWLVDHLTDELGKDAPLICTFDFSYLKEANIIIAASNTPEPIIFSHMLGKGPIVINDIAVPADTDKSVIEDRDDVTVISGGLVKLPLNPDFTIGGVPLRPGYSFACMAETILMGLTGICENYSYGRISKSQVEKILEISKIHGFSLGKFKTEKSY